MHMEF